MFLSSENEIVLWAKIDFIISAAECDFFAKMQKQQRRRR